jgi:hypothetical protein
MEAPRAVSSLQDLGIINIKEVLEMEDDDVASSIEALVLRTAASILGGGGYAV